MLKRTLLTMCAALMLCTFGASQAFGSFIIAVSLDGGATKTVVASGSDFTPLAGSTSFSGFTIDFLTATSTNGSPMSKLLTSNLSVMHTGGVATDVLSIFVTQTNYTLPAGPFLSMVSSAGGSSPTASNNPVLTGIFQAYYDAGNALYGTGNTNGLQNASVNGGSYLTGDAYGLFANSGLYSVTSQLNIVLALDATTNVTTSISLTAVPVPTGLVLAASAVPLVGFGWLRRRRIAKA